MNGTRIEHVWALFNGYTGFYCGVITENVGETGLKDVYFSTNISIKTYQYTYMIMTNDISSKLAI